MVNQYRFGSNEIGPGLLRPWRKQYFFAYFFLAWFGLGGSMLSAPQLENLSGETWELYEVKSPDATRDFGRLGTEWCFAPDGESLWCGEDLREEDSWALYGRNLLIRSGSAERVYRIALISSDQLVLRGRGQIFRFRKAPAP